MGTTELEQYLRTDSGGRYYGNDVSADNDFERLESLIFAYKIELKREDARAILEHPINTTGLVIHTENEIERNENDGSDQTV